MGDNQVTGWRTAMVLVAVAAGTLVAAVPLSAQTGGDASTAARPSTPKAVLKTPWGEPDLQGVWKDDYQIPLQRPAQYADKEFLTDAERKAIDDKRAASLGRDNRRERGTEKDVAGAYNSVFISQKFTGKRTSMIVDPPNGLLPPRTPEAEKAAAADRAYRLALIQATVTCKNKDRGCDGGTYGPPSPLWNELPPRYNTGRLNRHDGPEDGSLGDRCMSGTLPDFGGAVGGFTRIVQTPGGISMFYEPLGQGQTFQRNIVMSSSPHVPPQIRQWWGDARAHWEGNTLVVDTTNFSAKTDYQGSRENRHLIERFTRLDDDTLEYIVTVEDPTVWTRSWTAKQELTKQDESSNRIYYEPRCFEGNFGLPALLAGARVDDIAFAEGRGPHPATKDNTTCDSGE
jgi:hypothetical protein